MIRSLLQAFIHPPALRLDGESVYIRPAQPDDWQAWALVREESRSFLAPWEPTWPVDALSKENFNRRLRRQAVEWREDSAYPFLIFEKVSDALVGGVALTHVRRGVAQMASMGYWASQRHARHGYTSQGARLALAFAFAHRGLHRVEAACLPHNEASRRLLHRVGFVQEGHARAYLKIDGQWADHLLYAILHEAWQAQAAPSPRLSPEEIGGDAAGG
jgi:[ribosomal protein S5]-alanine N-acetyltransferase